MRFNKRAADGGLQLPTALIEPSLEPSLELQTNVREDFIISG